eukprot:jgi/Chlat1/966/Chrsp108S01392
MAPPPQQQQQQQEKRHHPPAGAGPPRQPGVAPKAPVTAERPPAHLGPQYRELEVSAIATNTGLTEAPDRELSVLQQHVAYFDVDGDGVVYPWDTYTGFRKMAFNMPYSFAAMMVIHGAMSWITQDSWLPSPSFSILIKNIHLAKHGSDTGVYDSEGRFVPYKFDDIFAKYDRNSKGALTFGEILRMVRGNRGANDVFGTIAEFLEWGTTYLAAADEKGYVSKDRIRGMYDGTFFRQLEQAYSVSRQKKAQ